MTCLKVACMFGCGDVHGCDEFTCHHMWAGRQQHISPTCYNGVKSLNSTASTTADRKVACNCVKSLASRMGGNLNANNAASLPVPGKCGVNIPYKISTSTNCATIKF